MRDHYLLYIALPDGEAGEFQLIGESNSRFPSLWQVLFGANEIADERLRRVFEGCAQDLIVTDATAALVRFENVTKVLLRESLAHDVRRYLSGALEHLNELIAAWSFSAESSPVLVVSCDEARTMQGRANSAQLIETWRQLRRLLELQSCATLYAQLGMSNHDDWKSWAGDFGLALFTHEYFYGSFRRANAADYRDYAYDPLGSSDDLGKKRYRCQEEGQWGVKSFADGVQTTLIAPEWTRILRAERDTCERVWLMRDGRFALASISDAAGELLSDLGFDEVWPFVDGLALVRVGGKMGYLQRDGGWRLPPQWDEAWEFANGFAVVATNDRLTYIDRAGSALIDEYFDEAHPFTAAGVARVRRGQSFGLLRRDGSYAVELECAELEWHEALNGWNVLRLERRELLHADGSAWIHGEWSDYRVCVPKKFLCARRRKLVALLDWSSGRTLFAREADDLTARRAAAAQFLVSCNGKAALVDERGEVLLPAEYFHVEEFEPLRSGRTDSWLRVHRKGNGKPKQGAWCMDSAREIVPCEYDVIWTVTLSAEATGFLVATKTHVSSQERGLTYKVGLLHADGSMLVPQTYAWIGDPTALGKATALARIRSAIQFAAFGRGLAAERWEDGVVERIELERRR